MIAFVEIYMSRDVANGGILVVELRTLLNWGQNCVPQPKEVICFNFLLGGHQIASVADIPFKTQTTITIIVIICFNHSTVCC